jgi:hypothetical protein
LAGVSDAFGLEEVEGFAEGFPVESERMNAVVDGFGARKV